ncbi:pectin lyase A [Diaporthe sp. PMI_573]|nr:pectin lyase A [Diaporthaceae sp. PMI_573]
MKNFTVTPKGVLNAYERCGGIGHYGPTACSQGIDVTCTFHNDYYSQCWPVSDPNAPVKPKPAGPKPTKLSPLVNSKPVGFASGVTGGGDAEPVRPKDVNELSDLLQDPEPRVIVIDKTFDYTTAMGTGVIDGCKPWGDLESRCQVALGLGGDWCNREKPDAPKVQGLEFNKAGISPLWIRSHKTIIGESDKGIIVGRSIRMMGVENIIIQNVKFTSINEKYVWGGDGLDVWGSNNIWLDHLTISRIGRQLVVVHEGSNQNITISSVHFDGFSQFHSSLATDPRLLWGSKFSGQDDSITFINNYMDYFSGRAPQVGDKNESSVSLTHVVNNVWEAVSSEAHAFEVLTGGVVLAEGNFIYNTSIVLDDSHGVGLVYTPQGNVDDALCTNAIGRPCIPNNLVQSGPFNASKPATLDVPAWKEHSNYPVAEPADEKLRDKVKANAGFGKL